MKKITLLLVLILVLAITAPVLAHERRTTDDGLQLIFGWWSEPAISGEPNGPEIYISMAAEEGEHEEEEEHEEGDSHGDASSMVTDAELQVEVSFGDQSITLDLRPAWNDPGHYVADMMPMLPGDYTFRVFGTAGGVEIDEVFSSADGQFSSVEPASDVQFPIAPPSNLELMLMIESLQAQIDELRAALAE